MLLKSKLKVLNLACLVECYKFFVAIILFLLLKQGHKKWWIYYHQWDMSVNHFPTLPIRYSELRSFDFELIVTYGLQ